MRPSRFFRHTAAIILALPLAAQASFLSVDSTDFSIGSFDDGAGVGARWQYDPSATAQSGSANENVNTSEHQYSGAYKGGWSSQLTTDGYQFQVGGSGSFSATLKAIPAPDRPPNDPWDGVGESRYFDEALRFSQVITLSELTDLTVSNLIGSDPANSRYNSFEIHQEVPCFSIRCGKETTVTLFSLSGNIASASTQLGPGTYTVNFSTYSGPVYLYTATEANEAVDGWNVGESQSGAGSISGSVTASFSPVSAVPVPAAAWLFGSALLGLIGRRKFSS